MSGLQTGVAGAFLGDSASNVFSGAPSVTSAGSVAAANVAGSPYTISIAQANSLTALNGYAFSFVSSGELTVNPATLTVSGAKVYDSTSGFTVGALSVSGGVNGETVTLTSGSGTTTSANAGSYAGSSLAGLSISVSGGNALASNYQAAVERDADHQSRADHDHGFEQQQDL